MWSEGVCCLSWKQPQIAKKEENMVTQKEVISLVKARKDVQELD